MAFGALEEILEQCSREGEPFWRVVLKDDINERNVTEEESIRQMEELWDAAEPPTKLPSCFAVFVVFPFRLSTSDKDG